MNKHKDSVTYHLAHQITPSFSVTSAIFAKPAATGYLLPSTCSVTNLQMHAHSDFSLMCSIRRPFLNHGGGFL